MSERQSIKITQEQAGIIFGGDSDDYELVDSGHWDSYNSLGDSQTATCIVKGKDGHYRFSVSRDGSAYTEWTYYFDNYLEPVKEVEVTVKKWVTD